MARGHGGPRPGSGGPSLKLPVTTAPGQPYGVAGAQAAAQKALPIASGPTPTAAPSAPQQPHISTAFAGLPSLFGRTQRPDEPVTAGISAGPGPGPEALTPPPTFRPDPMASAVAAFQGVPASHLTPQMRALMNATTASAANASGPGVAQGSS